MTGQEGNGDDLWTCFRSFKQKWYVECNSAIFMSTHNIQFHYKIIKKSLNVCFLKLSGRIS